MREMRLDKLMKLREVNPMNTLKQISRCYSELCELFLVNLSVFKFRFIHVRPSSWMVFCIEEFVKHFQQVFRLKNKIRRKTGSTSGFPSLLNQIDALTSLGHCMHFDLNSKLGCCEINTGLNFEI
jgi:hypothetical protein